MLNSVFITLPGKYMVQKRLEVISNNLANANTAGFKSARPSFSITTGEEGAQGGSSLSLPSTTVGEMDFHINFTEAGMVETGGRLDVAIQGDGFFVINTENGKAYTRNGQFAIDGNKKLVTTDGSTVVGQGGADITVDGKEVTITEDGTIYVDKKQAGRLKIVDFKDKSGLRDLGKSQFINTNPDSEEIVPQNTAVKSGYFEGSNVNVMLEMVDMMTVMRAYESYTKVDQALNDAMTKLLEIAR